MYILVLPMKGFLAWKDNNVLLKYLVQFSKVSYLHNYARIVKYKFEQWTKIMFGYVDNYLLNNKQDV